MNEEEVTDFNEKTNKGAPASTPAPKKKSKKNLNNEKKKMKLTH